MSDTTTARFQEGPEGRKEWEAWMATQPDSVQKDWDKYNEEHGDKFTKAAYRVNPFQDPDPEEDTARSHAKAKMWDQGFSDYEKGKDPVHPKDAAYKSGWIASFKESFKDEKNRYPLQSTVDRIVQQKFGRQRLSWDTTAAKDEPLQTQPDYGSEEGSDKTAAGGLYGFTKRIQRDVEASIHRVQKQADQLARRIWAKDERTAKFLMVHAEREDNLPARILLTAMESIGPRVATAALAPMEKDAAKHSLYGFRQSTVKLGLQACVDFKEFAGQEAYGLHQRRAAEYEQITGFLQNHSKRGRCKYSRLLFRCYPPRADKLASSEKASIQLPGGTLTWDE